MDEPFAGVDPIAIESVHNLMHSLVKKNIGILITDHNAKEILRIVDKVFLMNWRNFNRRQSRDNYRTSTSKKILFW